MVTRRKKVNAVSGWNKGDTFPPKDKGAGALDHF